MLVWNAHKTKVRCLAFSPDGKTLASSADAVTTVRLWEPTSNKLIGELRGRWGFTSGIAFSPTERLIATTTMNYRVVIWDAEKRTALSAAEATGVRYGPAFAPDSSAVAAVGFDGAAVWHEPATTRPESLGPYSGDTWAPDERLEYKNAPARVVEKFDSVAFSPDGRFIAANGTFRAVVWDRETGKVHRGFPHAETDSLTVVTFSADGEQLAITWGKTVEIHTAKGKPVLLKGHTLFVRAIGFTPDGRTVMTASSDGTVRFWDAATGAETRMFDWGIGRVYSAAFSPDGLTCAAGGEKGQVVIWDVDV